MMNSLNKFQVQTDRNSLSARKVFCKYGLALLGACALLEPSQVYAAPTLSSAIEQQSEDIVGTVTDNNGEPIIGANVMVKGTTNGTITDLDGKFRLTSPRNVTLIVTYVGYEQATIKVNGKSNVTIVLREDKELLDEVVVVGYASKQKKSLTASVETIDTKGLDNMPVGSASNALAGRAAGLVTVQTTGALGGDGTEIMVRGIGSTGSTSPLIIVDGIPRGSLNEIDVNNVKSYTVLKDAAAVAPYGIGGANGVILIETKSGTSGKPVLKYNGWIGWSKPTLEIDYADSYQYASTYNKAQELAGVPADQRRFSANDLEMYRRSVNGDPSVDRNLYPVGNVRDYLFRNSAPMTNHNINVSGGTDFVKYYVGINNMYQEEQWDNAHLNRTGIVSKLDFQLFKKTKFGLSINAYTQKLKTPQTPNSQFFAQLQQWKPIDPIEYRTADGQVLPASSSTGNTVLSDLAGLGNYTTRKSVAMISAYIEQELAKGLTLKGVMSYDWTVANNKNWTEIPSDYYVLDNSTQPYSFSKVSRVGYPSLSEGMNQVRDMTYQGILTYKGHYKDHGFGALFVAEARSSKYNDMWASRGQYQLSIPELNLGSSDHKHWGNGGSSAESAQVGFVGQLNYDYKQKYLIELTGRYDGHYYFAPGNKWGFFPAMALGWRISEEEFMKKFENIDNLKIRASIGQSGALAGGPNQYADGLGLYGDSYPVGGVPSQGIFPSRQGNPLITWEKATKYNVGVDFDLFKGQLTGKVDYFFEKRDNMLVSPSASVPTEYGIPLAQVNAGEMQNQGIEFELNGHKRIGKDWQLNGGFVFTFARNKLLEIYENEATRDNPNRSRTGHALNTLFGYKDLGLFQVSDDKNGDGVINKDDGFPQQNLGGVVTPGSIRYADINGDGVVDINDESRIGYSPVPEIIYGFNLGATWKGIGISMLFQGAAHSNACISGPFTEYFGSSINITKDNLDFWTPENPNAQYPIPRPNGQSANDLLSSSQASTFYMMNMNYLRLKQLEVSYNLPRKWLEKISLNDARIYVGATNLFTLSHTRGLIDPEQNAGSSRGEAANRGWYQPQNKTISVGVNITF